MMNFFRKKNKDKKIGLALGGGAVLGAAHIGVLKVIEEYNISVSYAAGTSIGALTAALFAFGKKWNDIEDIAKNMHWLDISEISLSRFGLLSNRKIGKIITDNIGDVDFEDSPVPLSMIATDITTGEKIVLNKGSVADAVMASTCIPGVFVPVEIDNRLLVDGGIVENVPVATLKQAGADLIIGVDLHAGHARKKPENIIEVLLRSFDFSLHTATQLQTEKADFLIKPDLSSFNMINSAQTVSLIEKGYEEAKKVLKKISSEMKDA